MTAPRIVLLRGYSANPWDLRPWRHLSDRYDVACLVTGRNEHDADRLGVRTIPVRALRDLAPPGRVGNVLAYGAGDRYVGLEQHLEGAAVVHAADIGTWFTAQAARSKARLGFRLVVTVWETIPFARAYRWPHERRYRSETLAAADLYLPATERARQGLLLEGVPEDRIIVSAPGIDTTHFRPADPPPGDEPLVLSPGRLVWEKGHQDVLRAVAALRHGIVPSGPRAARTRLLIVGAGPELRRLRRYADDLGVADAVEFRVGVPYDDMPQVYAGASAMVLASLTRPGWEEQFGMVLAEAMACGVPIVACSSGAIPEVLGSAAGSLVTPGDWMGLARALGDLLETPPVERAVRDPARVGRFSDRSAAERLAAAYARVLGGETA